MLFKILKIRFKFDADLDTDCPLGYSTVCTHSSVETETNAEMKEVCPTSHNAGNVVEEEGMCYRKILFTLLMKHPTKVDF